MLVYFHHLPKGEVSGSVVEVDTDFGQAMGKVPKSLS